MAEGQADENPKEQSAVMQFETKQLVVRKMQKRKMTVTHAHWTWQLCLQELQDSRNELLSRVANLKKVGSCME